MTSLPLRYDRISALCLVATIAGAVIIMKSGMRSFWSLAAESSPRYGLVRHPFGNSSLSAELDRRLARQVVIVDSLRAGEQDVSKTSLVGTILEEMSAASVSIQSVDASPRSRGREEVAVTVSGAFAPIVRAVDVMERRHRAQTTSLRIWRAGADLYGQIGFSIPVDTQKGNE